MSDFRYDGLEVTAHRPWAMPRAPWVMTQTWHDLLFAHWRVAARDLQALVPPELPLDTFEGDAWVGVVPFHMTNVAPRALPAMPWLSAFPEINVRTYVRVGERPGVYFFSLDAGSRIAAAAARVVFGLPYFTAAMTVEEQDGCIRYASRRESAPPAEFSARYCAAGAVHPPAPGTLEHFLTERYCLYAVNGSRRVHRLEIHHPPWPLQGAEADIRRNTMAAAAGITLPPAPPVLHFAKRQDMVAWPMTVAEDGT